MNSHLIANKGTLNAPGNGLPFYKKQSYRWENQVDIGENHLTGLWAGLTTLPPWQLWGTSAAVAFDLVNMVSGTAYDMMPFLEATYCMEDGTKVTTYRRGGPPATITCGRWQFIVQLGAAENTYYSEVFNVVTNAELLGADFCSLSFRQSTGWLDHSYFPSGYFNTFYFKERRLARPTIEIEEEFKEDGFGNKMLTYALMREYIGTSLLCPDYLVHLLYRIGLHDTINFRTGLSGKTVALTNFSATDKGKADDYWHFCEVKGIVVDSTLSAGQCGTPPSPQEVC